LLLLHGLADNSLVWSSLGDFLAPEYHIVAPDLRGHGDSSKPETGYRFVNYISDLEALMKYLNWQSVHAVAHSWSAKLLAIWATQHPDHFRSLILVDPFFIDKMPNGIQITFPLLYRILPFLKTMGSFPNYTAAENAARRLKQYRGWTPLQKAAFQAGMEEKADGTWGSKFVIQARNEIFADVRRMAGLTQTLDIPTLFVKPQAGLNRSQWQLAPYRKYLQNLEIAEVPGNHWPFLVEAEAFNRRVALFLSRQIV
jgi:pimeloyl-ACP methyl ester carboxylesterase